MTENTAGADGYYGDDNMDDEELDLSFLDEKDDNHDETGNEDK